jgi:hypothetical protein
MALRSARPRAVQLTIPALPLLDLGGERFARDEAASVDVVEPLVNLVEHVEPINDLLERPN